MTVTDVMTWLVDHGSSVLVALVVIISFISQLIKSANAPKPPAGPRPAAPTAITPTVASGLPPSRSDSVQGATAAAAQRPATNRSAAPDRAPAIGGSAQRSIGGDTLRKLDSPTRIPGRPATAGSATRAQPPPSFTSFASEEKELEASLPAQLGVDLSAPAGTAPVQSTATALAFSRLGFGDPDGAGIVGAIILSEIFRPPIALRRKALGGQSQRVSATKSNT